MLFEFYHKFSFMFKNALGFSIECTNAYDFTITTSMKCTGYAFFHGDDR